jgi:hypothetical protein
MILIRLLICAMAVLATLAMILVSQLRWRDRQRNWRETKQADQGVCSLRSGSVPAANAG